MKSLRECLETLVRCAGGDGNLLLNVGPMPDGRIEPRQVKRLEEMGEWLKKYGETIYGTRGGPWKPGKSLASTRKGNTIYLHLLDWNGRDRHPAQHSQDDHPQLNAHRRHRAGGPVSAQAHHPH